jgi:hypothetical protein
MRTRSFAPAAGLAVLLGLFAAAVPAAAQSASGSYVSSYYENRVELYAGGKLAGRCHEVDGPGPSGWFAVAWSEVPPPVRPQADREPSFAQAPSFAYFAADGKPLAVKAAARAMDAGPFASGRARLLEADREALYNYIDESGAWAIPPRFAEAGDFSGGRAYVREPGGRWGAIGADGSWLVAPSLAALPAMSARDVPSASGSDPRGGYSVEYAREASWGNDLIARSLRVSDPAGRVVSDGVFNALADVRGGYGVVALGGEVQLYEWYGCAPTAGAFGLYDFASGAFLVPPSAGQIKPVADGLWYVRPHGGAAYLFDDRKRASAGAVPAVDFLALSGPVLVGYAVDPARSGGLAVPALVNDDKVRLRAAPSTTGAVLAELSRGTKATAVEFKGDVARAGEWTGVWTRVELADGRKGWFFGYFLDYAYYNGL